MQKLYAEIKKELVENVIKNYNDYKEKVEQYREMIKKDRKETNRDSRLISRQTAFPKEELKRSLKNAETDQYQDFEKSLVNIKEHFNYVAEHKKEREYLEQQHKALTDSIQELKGLNKIALSKFKEKEDGTFILNAIKKKNDYQLIFGEVEGVLWAIDKYLSSGGTIERQLKKVIEIKNNEHVVKDNLIVRIEDSYFQSLMDDINTYKEAVDEIESMKESKNYLKYYLLFKQ